MTRSLSAHVEDWKYKNPIRIAGHTFTSCNIVIVEIREENIVGYGEASGVFFLNETPSTALDQIMAVRDEIEKGADRMHLLDMLPSGGARNAIDCALWDLECRLGAQTIWEKLNIAPKPQLTVQTIGLQPTPEDVASVAAALNHAPLLKIKLDANAPMERVKAVRRVRPDARLVIDANQSFDIDLLSDCLPVFKACGVEMIEQPLPRGQDAVLETLTPCIPLCADESCLDRTDLADASKRYQMINIKLDKTGGLTEALLLIEDLKRAGLRVMVGNMSGTSLAAAPGFVVAQYCDLVDLDGPLSLICDRALKMTYDGSVVAEPDKRFWG